MALQVGESVYDAVNKVKDHFYKRGYEPPFYLYVNRQIEFFDPDVIVIVDPDKEPTTIHMLAKPVEQPFNEVIVQSRWEMYFWLHTLLVEKLATWLNKLLRRVG